MSKWAKIELWVAEKDIEIDIIQVKQKIGMFVIKPKTQLTNGVYALHFGGMWDCNIKADSVLNFIYDFRIQNP